MTAAVLYVLPLLARAGLGTVPDAWWRVPLSLLPVGLAMPTLLLPRWVRHEEREHVWRHAMYAFAFTVAAGTSVRWDVIVDSGLAARREWATALLLYLAVGSLALWWFCASHVIENYGLIVSGMHTHHGDVAVLPLTLVAIATFASDVPDEAFQYLRSVPFFVPVLVAWATLHFVAFNDFAVSRTTTLHRRGFDFLAQAALVIASAHLTLLELRAPAAAFQAFPFVAAVLSQLMPHPDEPPRVRPGRAWGAAVVGGAAGAAVGGVLQVRFAPARVVAPAAAVLGAALCVAIPRIVGRRWPVPAALYAALLLATFLHAHDDVATAVRVQDALAIAAGFGLAFACCELLAPALSSSPSSPATVPTATPGATPQDAASCWAPSKLMRPLACVPVPCASGAYDADGAFLRRFYRREPSKNCPDEFVGVWWMCGNSFPMQLTTVHHADWSSGAEPVLWMRAHTTRSATLGGLLLWMGQSLCFFRVASARPWIRTDGWVLPYLRLLPDTYWLYRVSDDEMLRLVYDARGKVVWQYRMLRIARGTERERTRHFNAFVAAHRGRRYWYG